MGVIKALMHHQYRLNNLEGLYGAHHCTLWIEGTTIARAIGRLGRCQGVLSPRKGHLSPKTGFPHLVPTSARSYP
jgi:hypothetical protein